MSKGKYKRKRERTKEKAQQEAEHVRLQNSVVVSPKNCAANSATADHERDAEEKSAMRSSEIKEHISVSNVLLVIFTGVLAVVAVFQIVITNNQLNVMRIDQRAWLEMKGGFSVTPIGVVSGQRVMWPLKVTDIGKTPARNIEMKMTVEVVEAGKAPNLQCVQDDKPTFCSRNGVTIGIIYPNGDSSVFPNRITDYGGDQLATVAEATAWDDGKAYLAVYGIVAYDDVFNTHRWGKFCFWETKPGYDKFVFNAQTCTQFNSVDNNQ